MNPTEPNRWPKAEAPSVAAPSKRRWPHRPLVAVVALAPLPGAPLYAGSHRAIEQQALADVQLFARAGVDALLLENSHDLPYLKARLPPEAVRLITRIARRARQCFAGLMGIQLLEAANETALLVAAEADLDFVRVEGYVFAHVGGAGLIEGCAGRLLRLRREWHVEHVRLLADLKKKHCAHALTGDLDIVDELKQAEFFLVDGVIVTGSRTTEPPRLTDLYRVRRHAHVPVWIGSGLTARNLHRYYDRADGFIVGSTFRVGGDFFARPDPARVQDFVQQWRVCAGIADHNRGRVRT